MCFGGGGSAPSVPPPPPPAPVPTPAEPTEVAAQTAEQRTAQTKNLQYGILSTIKTSAGGLVGQGADLTAQASGSQKKTLGGA